MSGKSHVKIWKGLSVLAVMIIASWSAFVTYGQGSELVDAVGYGAFLLIVGIVVVFVAMAGVWRKL